MYLAGVYTLLIFTLYHNARKNHDTRLIRIALNHECTIPKPINFWIWGSLVHLVNKTTRFARRNNCPLWGDGKDDARREALI